MAENGKLPKRTLAMRLVCSPQKTSQPFRPIMEVRGLPKYNEVNVRMEVEVLSTRSLT